MPQFSFRSRFLALAVSRRLQLATLSSRSSQIHWHAIAIRRLSYLKTSILVSTHMLNLSWSNAISRAINSPLTAALGVEHCLQILLMTSDPHLMYKEDHEFSIVAQLPNQLCWSPICLISNEFRVSFLILTSLKLVRSSVCICGW